MTGPTVQILLQLQTQGTPQVQQATRATQDFTKAAEQAVQTQGRVQKEFVQTAGAFTALFVARQVNQGLLSFVETAGQMQKGLAGLQQVQAMSTDETLRFRDSLMGVSEASGLTFAQAAETAKAVLAGGFSAENTRAMMNSLGKLQYMTKGTSDNTAEFAITLQTLGLGAKDLVPSLDIMQNIANATSLQMKDFRDIMIRSGGVAKMVGLDFKNLAIAAGLTKAGFTSGAEQGTAFTRMMQELSQADRRAQLEAELHIDTINRETGALKPLPNLFYELAQKVQAGALGVGELTDIFGQKGMRGFGIAIARLASGMDLGNGKIVQGKELMQGFTDLVNNAGGEFERAFGAGTNTIFDKWQQLKNVISDTVGILGGPMVSGLTSVLSVAKGIGQVFRSVTQLPGMAGIFSVFASGAGVIIGAVTAFAMLGAAIKLVGVGLAFLGTSGTIGIAGRMIAHLGYMVKSTTLAFATMGLVAKGTVPGVIGLGAALRFLAGGLGPLLLIGSLLTWVLPEIISLFSGRNSEKAAAQKAAEEQDNALKQQWEAANAMEKVASVFWQVVNKFESLMIKKAPVFHPEAVKAAEQMAAYAVQRHGIPEVRAKELSGAVKTYYEAMARVGPGEEVAPEITGRMMRAVQQLGGYAAFAVSDKVGGGKRAQDLLQQTAEATALLFSQPNLLWTHVNKVMRGGGSFLEALPGAPGYETPGIMSEMPEEGPNMSMAPSGWRPGGQFQMPAAATRLGTLGGWQFGIMGGGKSQRQLEREDVSVVNIKEAKFAGGCTLKVDGQDIRGVMSSINEHNSSAQLEGVQ